MDDRVLMEKVYLSDPVSFDISNNVTKTDSEHNTSTSSKCKYKNCHYFIDFIVLCSVIGW